MVKEEGFLRVIKGKHAGPPPPCFSFYIQTCAYVFSYASELFVSFALDVCFLLGQKMVCLPIVSSIALSWFPFAYVKAKVVKIAIQLVKSYDFTSQYRLNVLNRSQNSEIGKIRSKSSKIVKIG